MMGPIEHELRRQRPLRGDARVAYTPALSFTALGVTFEAAAQLGLRRGLRSPPSRRAERSHRSSGGTRPMTDQRDGGISWTDETWNPIRGCSRVSAGCDNCYAMAVAYRFKGAGQPYEGLATLRRGRPDWTGTTAEVPSHLGDPLRWKRPRRIFVNSMSDLFHPSVSNEYIAAVFGVMAAAQQHTFQVLTKRPKRAAEWLAWADALHSGSATGADAITRALGSYAHLLAPSDATAQAQRTCHAIKIAWPLPNVWLGVSAENQATADERIPQLLALPAAVRFVSAEPLLGPLDLTEVSERSVRTANMTVTRDALRPNALSAIDYAQGNRLDWVIVGGESGNNARPFDLGWARSLVEQCKSAGVACFVKQMGSDPIDGLAGCSVLFQSKKGGDMNEWPPELQVQEFPRAERAQAAWEEQKAKGLV